MWDLENNNYTESYQRCIAIGAEFEDFLKNTQFFMTDHCSTVGKQDVF